MLLLDAPYKGLNAENVIPNRTLSFKNNLSDEVNTEYHAVHFDPYLADEEKKRNMLKKIILDFQPDGIIAGTGPTGQQVIHFLTNNDYPASFISFDDNEWYDCYGITAVRQDIKALIKTICEFILNDSDIPRFSRIPEKLIMRKIDLFNK